MVSDRQFIDVAAKGLKIEKEPFKPLSEKLGISVRQVIETIDRLIREGKVRRFAASVRHQPIGYLNNAMVIARTQEGGVDNTGETASALDEVSHCYHRPHPDGDMNCVYIMVHGQDEESIERAVEKIRNIPGVRELEVCRSSAELKKTSVSGVTTDLSKVTLDPADEKGPDR